MRRSERKGETTELVQRYQKQLEKRAEVMAELEPGTPDYISAGGRIMGVGAAGGGAAHLAGQAGGAETDTILRGKVWPTGLASLDVDLPFRGQHYRFTTPRGDAQITAYAVSTRFLEGLKPLGIVILAVLVVLGFRELKRRGVTFSLPMQSVVSTVLIVFGPIGLAFGIFPVLAAVGLIAGIVWKVFIRRARRRAATTA